MSRMVRKHVYIEREQEEVLKQRAKELGVSEAELIRRCIAQIGRMPGALPSDQKAWQAEVAYMRERACGQKTLGSQRHWTREELYEERLSRLSR